MTHRALVAAAAAVSLLTACGTGRAPTEGEGGAAAAPDSCTRCHGTGSDPAPPRSARGDTATTALGVGAHQAHLKDGALHRAFLCSECHVVPTTTAHLDGVARVRFGPIANANGVTSAWTRDAATCATWCHGASLKGGAIPAPVWTAGASQAACGSCHGLPPPAPHPATSSDCGACHEGYTRASVNLATHVDGKVQVVPTLACGTCHAIPPPAPHPVATSCGGCHPGYTASTVVVATHADGKVDVSMSCTSCHGDPARASSPAAPPKDTSGNTASNARGVGAHQSHLGATLAAPIACAECHVVPTNPAHANGAVELTFGALARAGGAAASWSGATCAVYCHGATLGGGTAKNPLWTKVDGTQKSCGSCHGAPPPAPHAQSTDCGSCHTGYTATSVNRATHVNGVVDVANMSCTSCHGDAARAASPAAPPKDSKGNTATTARGVGAHQAHLGSKLLAAPVACGECHPVPTSPSHTNGTVEVAFGALARTGGLAPSWNGATCAVYCHGSSLGAGGSATTPTWTKVDGTQKTCGSCHGAPPPAPHPVATDCNVCHSGYTPTTVNAATHLNGRIDVASVSCTTCHGDPARTSGPQAAPPADTSGNTATSARGVGAHQKHLTAGGIANALACTECHVVPTSTSHSNGVVAITFGALARTGGAAPAWSPGSLTCATTYCHGATLGGGAAKSPLWTKVDGTQTTCGSCHGAPPPAPHVQSTACGSCHTGYSATSVNLTTHVNGRLDVASLSCTSCHGDAARTSNPAAPPKDAKGNTATTARGVGAHQAHLAATLSAPVACADCHVVPTSTSHSDGAVGVTFSARAGGAAATWNATNLTCATSCHGTTLGAGGSATSPVWTKVDGTQKTCGSCHGAPPPAPHVQNTACGSCHTGYTATTVNVATHLNGAVDVAALACTSCHGAPPPAPHVQSTSCGTCHAGYTATSANAATHQNGRVDVIALSCTSCHGDATRTSNPAAPPKDAKGNTATTARGVGAHQAHLAAKLSAPVACADCHVVPTSTSHSNGAVGVTFSARAGGAAASWNPTNLTCATSCHGTTLGAGGSATSPVWTKVDGTQKTCGSCHGAPPPAPHVQNTACGSCHTGYTATTVNVATHLNGAVDVAALSCTSCHGAPPSTGQHGRSEHRSRSCGACHPGYTTTSANATLHQNGTKNVGGTGTNITSWNPTTRNCTATCHGSETW